MGFKEDWRDAPSESTKEYVNVIGDAFDTSHGVALLRHSGDFLAHANTLFEATKGSTFGYKKDEKAQGTIDVYWMADDGGLSMLLPHLLRKHKMWRGCKLRVMRICMSDMEGMSTYGALSALLKKFRFDCEVVPVTPDTDPKTGEPTQKPSAESMEHYVGLGVDMPEGFKAPTERYILSGEIIAKHSKDADAVFVSMPIPRIGTPPRLFMSWIDALSTVNRPVVLLRGSQETVISFYS
jgi:solute carrier family 12 sodium/potassium/chloride transporter 2